MRDVLRADLEFLDQFPRSAGVSETVFHANSSSDDRDSIQLRTLGQYCADSPSQGANLMLFRSHHNARIECSSDNSLLINRLQGVYIQYTRLVAKFFLQDVRGSHCLGDHRSASDDAQDRKSTRLNSSHV